MIRVITDVLQPLGLTQGDMRDPFLRRFQRVHDDKVFDTFELPLVRAGIDFRFAKTEYIGNHIGRALGKVLKLENDEPDSANIVRLEAFPDTLMYRTQLANTLRYDLKKHLGRSSTESTSLIEADDLLTEARVAIDVFDERIDHGKYLPEYLRQIREVAIPSLHFAGLIMANVFDEEPRTAHGTRLIHNFRMATPLLP